ncbi:hypothetical protein K1T71_014400 [Dendrolimus kikuchii]|uniref:Uncharacterized protein n=1 Tax=Dendrolimus kikuchii TaxID=765133 RepID=A0ACC1CEA8_9NEOP|nr:hypothetical protein K1T71_014400 [Dendrolimus kikuchii]
MRRRRYSTSSSSSEDVPLIAMKSNSCRYEVMKESLLREPSEEQCEICLKLFNNKYTYLVHSASHIIIPLWHLECLQCTNCSKYFTSQEDLNDHTKKNHPIVNVTNDNNYVDECNNVDEYNNIDEHNSVNQNNNADQNNINNSKVNESEVKRSYISVRKNLFNVTQDDSSSMSTVDKEEMDILNIDKILGEKVEFMKNRYESLVKSERLNDAENPDSIRNRIVFEDDAQALPSSILNDIVNECKDAMDLIEPSWLLNNLTHDSFDCDDDAQNGDSDAFKSQDGVNSLNVKDMPQIAADGELKTDAQSIFQNGVADLQHGAGILQNSAGILQNSAGILQSSAGILQNSAEMLQNSILQNGPNILLDGKHILQNKDGGLHNWSNILLDGSSIIQNAGGIIQTNAGILQNGPNIFLDSAGILNSNLIHYGAGNLGNFINNTHIGGMVGNCIDCLNNGVECRLHGVGSQNHLKTQQNNTIKQYPVNQNIQNIHGGVLFQLRSEYNQQYGLQGQTYVLKGQQHGLQGQRHGLQGHQHGLQGQRQIKLLGNRSKDRILIRPDSKAIDYKELIKPGVFKCKRCCKIYPNRLKLLKHEPTHIAFDRSKPDPCSYCEKYVLKEAMDRHYSKFHNGCKPVTYITPNKCRICGLNAYNWSLHYDLYHNTIVEKQKQETNKALFLCELCFKDMKSNSLEIKAASFTKGLCKRCKKQPVTKRVYWWTKKPLAERLKVIQKRLRNISQMNKY